MLQLWSYLQPHTLPISYVNLNSCNGDIKLLFHKCNVENPKALLFRIFAKIQLDL